VARELPLYVLFTQRAAARSTVHRITTGDDRNLERVQGGLENSKSSGVSTNFGLLVDVLPRTRTETKHDFELNQKKKQLARSLRSF